MTSAPTMPGNDALHTLLAERACERLVLEFADAIDARQFERLRELFIADATFYRPAEPDVAISGVDAIIDSYRTRLQGYRSQHLCTNVLVRTTSPDEANGVVRILFFAAPVTPETPPNAGPAPTMQVLGGFEDRYVRTQAGWRFRERRGRLHFQS